MRGEGLVPVAVERERYERLTARVLSLEDTVRRNSWLHQSRLAMAGLNEMLAGCEPLPGDRAAGSGGSAAQTSTTGRAK